MDNSKLFNQKSFWSYYQRSDESAFDKHLADAFAATNENGDDVIEFLLPCPTPFSIRISLNIDTWSISAHLNDECAKEMYTLGWWDDARWHPFFLKWDELQGLYNYWQNNHSHVSAYFLLLAKFVGNAPSESSEIALRKRNVAAAYETLNIFNAAEVSNLVEHTIIQPDEPDYRWSLNHQIGWEFSGNYSCYSIRNAAHADGAEGKFPFIEYKALIELL